MCEPCKPEGATLSRYIQKYLEPLAIGSFGVGFIFLAIAIGLSFDKPSLQDLGNLGQFVAGTTGIFWALSIGLYVVATFKSQQDEIAANNRRFSKERFESEFYNLISLHHAIVGALYLKKIVGTGEFKGRRCFQTMYHKLEVDNAPILDSLDNKALAAHRYDAVFDYYEPLLGHYFRNLYHIFTFVRLNNPQEEARYLKIIGAQLSTYELLLLFYNGIGLYGEKFKKEIEETGFLEQLKHSELVCKPPELQLLFYKKSASGKKELPDWLVWPES